MVQRKTRLRRTPIVVIETPPAGGVRSATERSSALSAKKERSDVAISGKFYSAKQLPRDCHVTPSGFLAMTDQERCFDPGTPVR